MGSKINYGVVGAIALVSASLMSISCGGQDKDGESSSKAFRGFNEPVSGAIFTTLSDGSAVNANIYENKEDVYLDGGPGMHAPASAAGLPAGDYYFQVTDPSGKDLLSEDHISCRRVTVNDAGVIARVHGGTNYEWRAGSWVEAPCQHTSGIDSDHSEDGAITVQLMPYANTPNNGGVYKAWMTPVTDYTGDPNFVPSSRQDSVNGELWEAGNFHGFVPASSKTDNFKVKKNGPKPQVLTVRKFHDANLNTVKDDGEVEINGWEIAINDPVGTANYYYTPVFTFVTEGLWAVLEATPTGSEITAAYLDGALQSYYPTANPLVLVTVAGTSDEKHDVLYGDVGVGQADACKIYDADGDGVADEGEVGVAGWHMRLTGTDVRGMAVGPIEQVTGEDGCTRFIDLLPGSYTIAELTSGGDWVSTGQTSVSFEVTSTLVGAMLTGTHTDVAFTNYCKTTADFGTKGYWHNRNGLAEVTDDDVAYVNGLSPYASPSSYFGQGDEPFDGLFADGSPVPEAQESGENLAPAGSANAEISNFLVDANAGGDAHEQLAQQLLAFLFNIRHRTDGPDARIQQPDGSFVRAGDLIDQAIAAWESGSSSDCNAIATTLDGFNNNDAVVIIFGSPCALP